MPRHLKILCTLGLLIAFFAAGCSTAGHLSENGIKAETAPFVGGFQVHRFTLKNGLKVLVVEDHSSPTFAYQTWFKVGSRQEVMGRTGLAHLFEHMMFKGTKTMKDGEFDRVLDSVGTQGENAFTTRDYTAYVQELPVRRGDKAHEGTLDLIARLEADRMVNLIVDQKAFKTETEVVQNERRFRYENNADGLVYQEIFSTAFQKHPYHWPVIGYQQDLDAMSANDAVKFYRSFYSPNHATIVVVGDVDPGEVLGVVEKHYGNLSPQNAPLSGYEQEPAQDSPRRKQLKLNIQVDKMAMAYRIPGASSEDMPALSLISAILTNGKSSRLYRGLVETGIATGADIYDPDNIDPTLFAIFVNFQKGKRATQGESIVLRELSNLVKSEVPEGELQKAKNTVLFNFYQELEGNHQKANFLGRNETLLGDFEAGVKLMDRIKLVTAKDIQATAAKYFSPQSRTVITGVPK